MLRKVSYKIITLLVLLCAAAVLSISALAADKTVYLSAAEGSDSFDGSASAPFATLKAAIEAVKSVGLNQISEIPREWFPDKALREMFFSRLEILKNAN